MDDMAELALEGASYGIENFDKVYDPLKAKVQNMRNSTSKSGGSDPSRYRDDHDDKSPSDAIERRDSRQDYAPRNSELPGRDGRRYVKETYYRESGRAKSAGREGYNGEGWGRDPRGRGLGQCLSASLSRDFTPAPPIMCYR